MVSCGSLNDTGCEGQKHIGEQGPSHNLFESHDTWYRCEIISLRMI
jgi:hypothetical protein